MSSAIEAILGKSKGKDEPSPADELAADAVEPEGYRPYLMRARPQMAFALIESTGTAHGFMYHTLRHPKHEVRDGEEFLSFAADGIAVVMQGSGLYILFLALLRHTLIEVRAYDGKAITDGTTRITRLEVSDAVERLAAGAQARLVK
jgi:hypothetical protein